MRGRWAGSFGVGRRGILGAGMIGGGRIWVSLTYFTWLRLDVVPAVVRV